MFLRFIIISLFILLIGFSIFGQSVNIDTDFVHNGADNKIVVTGKTDFPVKSVIPVGTGRLKAGGDVILSALPAVTVDDFGSGGTTKGANFKIEIGYGSGQMLSDVYKSAKLDFVVTPVDAATVVKTESISFNLNVAEKYFNIARENDILITRVAPTATMPNITVSNIKPYDNLITLDISSDVPVTLKTEAFKASATAADSVSDTLDVARNGTKKFELRSNIKEKTVYEIKVTEVNPPAGRSAFTQRYTVNEAGLIKTIDTIRQPQVSITAGKTIGIENNRKLKIPVQGVNSPRVRIQLQTLNNLGIWNNVESPVVVKSQQIAGSAFGTDELAMELQNTVLSQDKQYQVLVKGLTEYDDVDKGNEVPSASFKGLSPLLSQAVNLQFVKEGLKVSTNTNGVSALLNVAIGLNKTSFAFTTSDAGGSPFIVIPVSTLTSSPEMANNSSLPLTIKVQAQDGTERESSFSMSLSVDKNEITSKSKKVRQKIGGFVTELKATPEGSAPNDDKGSNIKTGDLIQTGLGVLLKFLIPILL